MQAAGFAGCANLRLQLLPAAGPWLPLLIHLIWAPCKRTVSQRWAALWLSIEVWSLCTSSQQVLKDPDEMTEPSPQLTGQEMLWLIKARRSIRRYKPDPVPDDMIEQLLEAGRWAPSASNRQPWAFIVVRNEAIRRQLAQNAAYYVIRWAQVGEAPLLIVLCGDARNPIYRQFLHEDVGLAGAQIMLQAHAMGLGTCWIGGLDRAAVAGILRLPDYLDVVGLITVGFPAEEPEPRPRKPLAEVVHYDAFGNREPGAVVSSGRLPGGWLLNLLRRLRLTIRPGRGRGQAGKP